MAIFAIISPQKNEALTAAIEREFPKQFLEFAPGQFVVSAENLSTAEIKNKLGITDGGLGRVVLFSTVGSAGWHKKSLWEWLERADS